MKKEKNITPRMKAKELFNKYRKAKSKYGWQLCEFRSSAKQCSLIAVDEIINILSKDLNPLVNYWFEVKHKLEKL